jgi:protein-S-isoprenylcysteine O-methyltransferase Ste14
MLPGVMEAPPRGLPAQAFAGLAFLAIVMGLLLFVAAGTVHFVAGWQFLVVFLTCSLAITLYLLKHDPALLARRVKAGPVAEQRPRQRLIQGIASAAFLALLAVPGLDRRFGWTHLGAPLVVVGDAGVVAGFLIVFLAFRENSFASAVIEVGAAQKVIDTGPYARVRHPMYAGALLLVAGIPAALGSLWGLAALVPLAAVIVWRLLDEEVFLTAELPGYIAYCRKVRYRLIPFVW